MPPWATPEAIATLWDKPDDWVARPVVGFADAQGPIARLRTPGEVRLAVKNRWLALNRNRLKAAVASLHFGSKRKLEQLWRSEGCRQFRRLRMDSLDLKAIANDLAMGAPRGRSGGKFCMQARPAALTDQSSLLELAKAPLVQQQVATPTAPALKTSGCVSFVQTSQGRVSEAMRTSSLAQQKILRGVCNSSCVDGGLSMAEAKRVAPQAFSRTMARRMHCGCVAPAQRGRPQGSYTIPDLDDRMKSFCWEGSWHTRLGRPKRFPSGTKSSIASRVGLHRRTSRSTSLSSTPQNF